MNMIDAAVSCRYSFIMRVENVGHSDNTCNPTRTGVFWDTINEVVASLALAKSACDPPLRPEWYFAWFGGFLYEQRPD
jgi:hypothetical protein